MRKSFEQESRTKSFLPKKVYAIIRLDGKAFHTFTKQFKRPFDESFIEMMNVTAQHLCQKISGVKLAYVQSDEISLILTDFDTQETQAWYDGNIQKIVSVSASIATAHFNQCLIGSILERSNSDKEKIIDIYAHAADCLKGSIAYFDSRVFYVETYEEVIDYLCLRQKDAISNSISMVAQSLYSHKLLNNKSSEEKKNMIKEKGLNWSSFPVGQQIGRIVLREQINKKTVNPQTGDEEITIRHKWSVKDAVNFKDTNSLSKIIPNRDSSTSS